jgi:ribosomal protein L12E/L44/L45/RPP1/RPP2
VIDKAKFDSAKLKQYVETKKPDQQDLTRVTTTVNTTTDQITISVLVSPKKIHTREKSFEELFLNYACHPLLDASGPRTSSR